MPQIGDMTNPYTPSLPEPVEPFAPPSAQGTAPRFEPGSTAFEQANEAIAHAQNEYQRHINRVNEDRKHYTEQGYKAQIDKFTTTAAYKAIDAHAANVEARLDQAQADYDKVRRELSPDGDTAAELRATRFWDRTKAVLDAQDNAEVISKAQGLLTNALPAELGTLLQELESYCIARGVSTDWIEPAAAQASPQYARATAELNKAKQAAMFTMHNAARLRDAIAKRSQVPIPIAKPNRAGAYDPDR